MSLQELLAEPRRWVILGVSVPDGHPTYVCGHCFLQRVTIVTAGAGLPSACQRCLERLAPPRTPSYPHLTELMLHGGHANLLPTQEGEKRG